MFYGREVQKAPSASYKNYNPWGGGKRCFVGSFDYFDAIYAADVCCGGGRCRRPLPLAPSAATCGRTCDGTGY